MQDQLPTVIDPAGSTPPLPLPRIDITIRPGTLTDLAFIDGLQKMHTKQVGWFPSKTLEGKIRAGHVLVAEAPGSGQTANGTGQTGGEAGRSSHLASLSSHPTPIGYLIGNDQYFKRDDVGIIYQLNVAPGRQRGLIGATLLKAQFERSAYGCRLYCCWCAQDIAANHFWEAMGFVPLAFRTGSEKRARTHIFWQKRIRQGDTETPWWFPSKTGSGSLREDRLVLPIPPGTHWSDAKPLVLPGVGAEGSRGLGVEGEEKKALPGAPPEGAGGGACEAVKRSRARKVKEAPAAKPEAVRLGGFRFAPPEPPEAAAAAAEGGRAAKVKRKREPKQKRKNDPKLVAAARELRDRWLERVNDSTSGAALPAAGKYDVSRLLEGAAGPGLPGVGEVKVTTMLPAA